MSNTITTAVVGAILGESGRAISKLYGRRNYIIRMEMIDKRALVGGMGVMNRRGLMSEFLSYMAKHGTTWAEFTYKKDLQVALDALENNGFEIIWLD